MYKIYINDLPLIICNSKNIVISENITIKTPFVFNVKALMNYIDLLEKQTDSNECILFYTDRVEEAFDMLCSLFKIVPAAGGIVLNDNKELLLIYRNDKWDLPKGKIDQGESTEDAAVREVEEEVGLSQLTLGAQVQTTYHTYRTKKHRILKPTYWYIMNRDDINEEVIVQAEENITDFKWVSKAVFFSDYCHNCYTSLVSLIKDTSIE